MMITSWFKPVKIVSSNMSTSHFMVRGMCFETVAAEPLNF